MHLLSMLYLWCALEYTHRCSVQTVRMNRICTLACICAFVVTWRFPSGYWPIWGNGMLGDNILKCVICLYIEERLWRAGSLRWNAKWSPRWKTNTNINNKKNGTVDEEEEERNNSAILHQIAYMRRLHILFSSFKHSWNVTQRFHWILKYALGKSMSYMDMKYSGLSTRMVCIPFLYRIERAFFFRDRISW